MIHQTKDIVYTDQVDLLSSEVAANPLSTLVLVCLEGSMQISVSERQLRLSPGQLIVTLPNTLIGHYMRTPDFQGRAIIIGTGYARDVLMDCFREQSNWYSLMREVEQNPIMQLTDDNIRLMKCYFDLLEAYLGTNQTDYRIKTYRLLASAAACEILAMLSDKVRPEAEQPAKENTLSGDVTFRRFLELLHHDDGTHREVNWYAEQMHKSAKYLSSLCKERSGHTAGELIAGRVTVIIKEYLRSSDLSVKEIAARMGFITPAYFSKYVMKHLGDRPTAVRRKLRMK